MARGATNREVAAELFLSPKTIEFHLGRVYRKLGIHSRTELAALAAEGRLAPGVMPNPHRALELLHLGGDVLRGRLRVAEQHRGLRRS